MENLSILDTIRLIKNSKSLYGYQKHTKALAFKLSNLERSTEIHVEHFSAASTITHDFYRSVVIKLLLCYMRPRHDDYMDIKIHLSETYDLDFSTLGEINVFTNNSTSIQKRQLELFIHLSLSLHDGEWILEDFESICIWYEHVFGASWKDIIELDVHILATMVKMYNYWTTLEYLDKKFPHINNDLTSTISKFDDIFGETCNEGDLVCYFFK